MNEQPNSQDSGLLQRFGFGLIAWNFFTNPMVIIGCFISLVICAYAFVENQSYLYLSRNKFVDVTFDIKWGESLDQFLTHAKVDKYYGTNPTHCVLNPTQIKENVVMTDAFFYHNHLYKVILKVNDQDQMKKINKRLCRYASVDNTHEPTMPYYELEAGSDLIDAQLTLSIGHIQFINNRYSPSHGLDYD